MTNADTAYTDCSSVELPHRKRYVLVIRVGRMPCCIPIIGYDLNGKMASYNFYWVLGMTELNDITLRPTPLYSMTQSQPITALNER